MELTKAFFQLQLSFAEKVAQVTHVPLEEVLLDYTTLYLSLELGRSFDPAHPIWQAYLQGLKHAPDRVQWTYTWYQRLRTNFIADFYGCFYYSYLADEQTIRIHFINRETAGQSALSQARQVARVQELASHVSHHPVHPPGGHNRARRLLALQPRRLSAPVPTGVHLHRAAHQ